MIQTESLEIEYTIFYSIFRYGKKAHDVLRHFKIQENHFANLFHRQFFKELDNKCKSCDFMSLQGFYKYFKSILKNDKDSLKLKECIKGIKKNSVHFNDLKPLVKQFCEMYAIRYFSKAFNEALEEKDKGKSFEEAFDKFTKNTRNVKNIIHPETDSRCMGLKSGLAERQQFTVDIKNNPEKLGMIETGFINFDKFIGNQMAGRFILYQARTNMGKSMFLMGTAVHNHKKKRKGIIITIEMSSHEYLMRMDANLTGIPFNQFSSGDISMEPELMKKWQQKIDKSCVDNEDLLVYWVPSNCTPDKVREIVDNNPFIPDYIIVDYAGDMKSGLSGVPDYDPKSHGAIYSALKEVAGEYNAVLFSAQQTKRGVKKVDAESGSWSDVASNKADIIIAIECTDEDRDFIVELNGTIFEGRLTLTIVKGRNIPKCRTHIIPMFHKMTWIEKEMEEMMGVGFKSHNTEQKENEENISKDEEAIDNNDNQDGAMEADLEDYLNNLD